MAQPIEESFLDKLLRTRYPLTYYLSRQQQFVKFHSITQTIAASTPEPSVVVTNKRKVPLPPPACFNVPDTLDFNGTARNNNRTNESICDLTSKINSSIIKRTSAIHLEFSPYEQNSPLNTAIHNGLNIINKYN
ncbi:unnamed protein product [Rotaria socialis]|uniref:Uncharacterized protein n=1 Tax=Rotaria socialis TaxID=392032 RepID=A0A820E8W9_9BILA|nr:unnamed protein product [Rotaria socialis]CAF4244955.1 unnamed protein product [Rotaria socialis]CAF4369242.1 unnamed protein product [Rotaria socialis]CAF4511123.1 unnamed protein product [Rotaria socialis]CAF4566445.1 unnamed protein product [Rotaria socialis]